MNQNTRCNTITKIIITIKLQVEDKEKPVDDPQHFVHKGP